MTDEEIGKLAAQLPRTIRDYVEAKAGQVAGGIASGPGVSMGTFTPARELDLENSIYLTLKAVACCRVMWA